MDVHTLIGNIESWAKKSGRSVTRACIESGAGKDFVSNMKRGQGVSTEKLTMLAAYFGCTTSELLGEEKKPTSGSGDGQDHNTIRMAGRDGSLVERKLTDEQMAAFKLMLDQLPDADDL